MIDLKTNFLTLTDLASSVVACTRANIFSFSSYVISDHYATNPVITMDIGAHVCNRIHFDKFTEQDLPVTAAQAN